MKTLHEQLKGYLEPSRTPNSVVAPTAALNARLPLGPDAPLPIGIRPVPASTQTSKKTNAQLPYVRKLVKDGSRGVFRYATEGDVVFVERSVAHGARKVHLPLAHAVAQYRSPRQSRRLCMPRSVRGGLLQRSLVPR